MYYLAIVESQQRKTNKRNIVYLMIYVGFCQNPTWLSCTHVGCVGFFRFPMFLLREVLKNNFITTT